MRAPRLAVLIHGHHCDTPNFEEVMWGSPPKRLGRGPAALKAAMDLDAAVLAFGTGGAKSGGSEAAPDLVHGMMSDNASGLETFDAFAGEGRRAETFLRERVRFAPPSRNSATEIEAVKEVMRAEECDGLVLVSSPDHLPRCLRDAHSALRGERVAPLMGCASGTAFSAHPPAIIEEPHRPDRGSVSLRAEAERMNRLRDDVEVFRDALRALLDRHGA